MKGLIHCHSENSRYDSTMKVKRMCERAKELGYEAITLTDHGTLTGIDDFIAAAQEVGIKPIPGVEAYMQEDNSLYKRFHLILLAKDDLGYQGIGKAVSDSNKRVERGFPRMNKEILERYFAPGKKYHGHVIATSACIQGVIAGIILSPFEFDKEIKKLKKTQRKYENPESASYKKNLELLKKETENGDSLVAERDQVTTLAKKAFKKKENALAKLEGTEEYDEAFAALQQEKKEAEEAKIRLEEIKEAIATSKANCRILKKRIKDSEEEHGKFMAYQKQIDEIESKKLDAEKLYDLAAKETLYYDNLFGHGNFFMELQYHGYLQTNIVDEESGEGNDMEEDSGTDEESTITIEIEKMAMESIVRLAKNLNIPMSIANDAHILDGSKESIRARQIICSIRYSSKKKTVSVRPGDDQLYLKSEEEMVEAIKHVADPDSVSEALANTYRICDECNCKFEIGEHYPKFKGLKPGEDSNMALKRMAYEGIRKRFPIALEWTEEYQKRLDYELSIIADMGYSDYFLIVQDFLEFGRKLGYLSDESIQYLQENVKSMTLEGLVSYVESHKEKPGFSIGAGRGSAAGSLVAYLVKITDIIDPLKYDLLFERFLNPQRVSMPDVDSDFSPDIRDIVVEYCKKLYGIESVTNIVTKGFMAPKGAIRNVARVIGIERDKSDYYLQLADMIAKKVPSKPGTSFATCEDELREAFKGNTDANEIIDQAKMVEGVFLNYGMHAAGIIIADGNPVSDYVPLMRDDKSGDMKVQCDMTQAEEKHGLLKFDFLGLRNLKIVTLTLRSIKNRTGIDIDVEHIPFERVVFEKIFASGKTGSIFQFESPGMKKMLRSAKPECLEDLIALVSLYRPGPMDNIPKYIEWKTHPENIEYLCPELEPILSKTYGVIVYQEQVMEIVQKLAGYSLSQADNVRRFMSKKKMDKLVHERESFVNGDPERGIEGCVKRGIDAMVANEIFDQMVEFAKYAFNKSHAAAYAVLSYITAYFKHHFPADYMCAVLNCTDDIKKMPSVLNDCREIGVKVQPPNINKSGLGFMVVDEEIVFGLDSVKGTRAASAASIIKDREENGEYVSFKDFLRRRVADKPTTENLIKAGAMDEFSTNRAALLHMYTSADEVIAKIKKKEQAIDEIRNEITQVTSKISIKVSKETDTDEIKAAEEIKKNEKEESKLKKRYEKAIESLESLNKMFDIIRIVDLPEDYWAKMKAEKEVLGFFVTSHPLNKFRNAEELGCIAINDLADPVKNVKIMGLIENLDIKKRKSDGKPMAFFDLEDKTGIIHVCCFVKKYEEFGEKIDSDMVVEITGNVINEVDEMSSEMEISFILDSVKEIVPDLSEIRMNIDGMLEWNRMYQDLRRRKYITNQGHPLVLYDNLFDEFRRTKVYVDESILKDNAYDCIEGNK